MGETETAGGHLVMEEGFLIKTEHTNQTYKIIFEASGVHMGRYGLILCENESYTNDLAIGIIFDQILDHDQIKNVYNC